MTKKRKKKTSKTDLILNRLKEDEKIEKKILSKLDSKEKDLEITIKRFDFSNFAHSVIGASVFGLPSFLNTSFWDYLLRTTTGKLFLLHIFFVVCVFIALNFKFRQTVAFNKQFYKELIRWNFYMYITVLFTIFLLLVVLNRIHSSMLTQELFNAVLAAQSVGIVGSTTFSFFSK